MSDFLDSFSQTQLNQLRNTVSSGTAENNKELSPGVYLSWDDDADMSIAYDSPDWAALALTTRISSKPRWQSLNLVLATGVLRAGDTLGLVVEGYADVQTPLKITTRSAINGTQIDCHWDDQITLHPMNNVAIALHRYEMLDGVVDSEGYHTLMIDLPPQSSAMTLRNIRLFRLPHSRELLTDAETLSSFAV